MALRRGFKAEAERLAMTTRQEVGLNAFARLDPLELAAFLEIPVISMSELAEERQDPELDDAVDVLHGPEQGAVSALTVMYGIKRRVVYNDVHDPGRIASSVAHELGHGLLLHMPAPVVDQLGCRIWNADYEDEASYLGGALLVPKEAALRVARRNVPLDEAAAEYGCSVPLMRWRVNMTGAARRTTPKPRRPATSPSQKSLPQ